MAHDEQRHNDSLDEQNEAREAVPNDLSRQQRARVAVVLAFVVGVLIVLAIMLALAAGVLGQP